MQCDQAAHAAPPDIWPSETYQKNARPTPGHPRGDPVWEGMGAQR